jgi:hypothetical protein
MASVPRCLICGGEVDESRRYRRDVGDFHDFCFDVLRSSGVGVRAAHGDRTPCLVCADPARDGSVVVELFGAQLAHLRCFFGEPNGRARSVGASAAAQSLAAASRSLRERSVVLRARSRRLLGAVAPLPS